MKSSFTLMRAVCQILVVTFSLAGLVCAADGQLGPLPPPEAPPAGATLLDLSPNFVPTKAPTAVKQPPRFEWHSAIKQSAYFLAIQHSFRMLTEPGTRSELKGPFFKDWFASVRGYEGWRDGDPAVVNYIGHPMMGSVSGFIQIQNDRDGKSQTFGSSHEYWKSRGRAMVFSAVYSTLFELGPVSEASLGNVGRVPHTSGMVDLVVTPTIGTCWLIAEDMVDRYIIAKLEPKIKNRPAKIFLRGVLNPSRSFSSMMAGHEPWKRYDRPGVWRRP